MGLMSYLNCLGYLRVLDRVLTAETSPHYLLFSVLRISGLIPISVHDTLCFLTSSSVNYKSVLCGKSFTMLSPPIAVTCLGSLYSR